MEISPYLYNKLPSFSEAYFRTDQISKHRDQHFIVSYTVLLYCTYIKQVWSNFFHCLSMVTLFVCSLYGRQFNKLLDANLKLVLAVDCIKERIIMHLEITKLLFFSNRVVFSCEKPTPCLWPILAIIKNVLCQSSYSYKSSCKYLAFSMSIFGKMTIFTKKKLCLITHFQLGLFVQIWIYSDNFNVNLPLLHEVKL